MKKIFLFMLKRTLKCLYYINTSSMFLFFSPTWCPTEIVSNRSNTFLSVILRWLTLICSPGQSCNIFVFNVPVHPIPSCFKCFINGIELKQLSIYTQNCSGESLLPQVLQLFTHHQFSKNSGIKNCDFWFQKNFFFERKMFSNLS